MSDTPVVGVDPVNGRSKLTYQDHTGPLSYATGGEKWPQQSIYGGPNAVGLSSILWVNGGFTESGNYYVVPIFGGKGAVKGQITLIWYTATSLSTGTPAQPSAATNLSAEKLRLLVLGG